MKHLPALLTTIRLLLGPVMVLAAFHSWNRLLFLPALLIGTISDIYDGVIARRLGVATPGLRRYDSITDLIYYLFVLASLWVLCRPQISAHWLAIAAVLCSEIVCMLTSLIRFRKFPATHSYLAKLYGLALFASSAALLAFDAPGTTLLVLTSIAILANVEILFITLLAKTAPIDVASIFVLSRRGSPAPE
jgi:CDP-diacylglycerol--glycerol-3-phosphate 3-phosphatidyltransferase